MFPYEQLGVYQKAYGAHTKIYRFLKGNKGLPPYIKTQLGRASLSVVLNIAEGSGKKTLRDRKNFLTTARGSAFECASIVNFLSDEGELQASQQIELYYAFDEISRMLYTMIQHLEQRVGN